MSGSIDNKSVSDLLKGRFGGLPRYDLEASLARFIEEAFAYANSTIGLADLREAWDVFRVWLDHRIDAHADVWQLFLAWYVFHWRASPKRTRRLPPTIAEKYLLHSPDALHADLHGIVQSAVGAPIDFYEVLYLPDLDTYYLKSLFMGYQKSFGFQRLPRGMELGNVYLAKVVHLYEDQGLIAGISAALGLEAKVAIGNLRRNLIKKRATDFMCEFWLFESDIFNLYRDLLVF